MKRVWVSSSIAILIVAVAVTYSYHRQHEMTAIKEQVSAVMEVQSKPIVAIKPARIETIIEIHDHSSDTNPLNLNDELLSDEDCCPEDERREMMGIHSNLNPFHEMPAEIAEQIKGDNSASKDWLKKHLIKKHGYSLDIDEYIRLLGVMTSSGSRSFQEVLDFARLEYKYNPSEDAKILLDEFESLAKHPELITDFWME